MSPHLYSHFSSLLSPMQHLEHKRVLVESCRGLLEALKGKEEEAAQHARHALDEVEAVVEQEKKSFRSSQDDRLQRVRYVMLCYVMLCYVMLCYVMLCYFTVYYGTSLVLKIDHNSAVSISKIDWNCFSCVNIAVACCIMLDYFIRVIIKIMLQCNVMKCYVTLCYVMICNITITVFIMLMSITLYITQQHYITQYNTTQQKTPHNTLEHSIPNTLLLLLINLQYLLSNLTSSSSSFSSFSSFSSSSFSSFSSSSSSICRNCSFGLQTG